MSACLCICSVSFLLFLRFVLHYTCCCCLLCPLFLTGDINNYVATLKDVAPTTVGTNASSQHQPDARTNNANNRADNGDDNGKGVGGNGASGNRDVADGTSTLASVAGQPVRFLFRGSGASIYSFWVSASLTGESNGYLGASRPSRERVGS
jgi:hypothetical protein